MFSAAMQDNGLAKIWGEDPTTGAGGANVVDDAFYRWFIPSGPFPFLPGGQNIRTAWRQTIRTGKHAGELIEDYGVARDANAFKTLDDVINHGATQLANITTDLAAQSANTRGSVYLQSKSRLDFAIGSAIGFDATVTDTDSVEVVLDGQLVNTQQLGVRAATLVHIDTGVSADTLRLYTFELHGLRNGVRVWRAFASARAIPQYTILPASGLTLDFSTGSADPLTIYTQMGSPLDGWHVSNDTLTTSRDNSNYADDTSSNAVLFLDLTGRTSLSLKLHAAIDTQKNYDFFRIFTVVNGQRTLLAEFSGFVPSGNLSYDLSALGALAGQKAQIDFQFSSDDWGNLDGVHLDHIALR
jgi:hypothetical protein